MKDIELQISQFIDNELSDTGQRELFKELSENESARKTLADFMSLKRDISTHYAGIEADLKPGSLISDKKIIGSVRISSYKTPFYFALAASVVLGMLLFWNQNEKEISHSQFIALEKQYSILRRELTEPVKSKTVEPAETKLPTVSKTERRANLAQVQNRISSSSLSILTDPDRIPGLKKLNEMMLNNRTTIGKEDLIGGQIVGN